MGTLTPEIQKQMIQAAISALLNPTIHGYNRDTTPIQQAFNAAVTQVTRDIALEHVKNDPEIRPKLLELMRLTADKVLGIDADSMATRMADAFVNSIRGDRD